MASTLTLSYSYKPKSSQNSPTAKLSKTNPTHKLRSSRNNQIPSKNDKFRAFQQSLSIAELNRYLDSGSIGNALQVFDKMSKRDSFVWNVVIRALTNNGYFEKAVEFYYQMQFEGVPPDKFTYPFVIKAFVGSFSLLEAQKVHSRLIKVGLDLDLYVGNSLISMYAKLGFIKLAERVFESLSVKDLVSWNSMISGFVSVGDGLNALNFLENMVMFGLMPDRFTVISGVGACSLERTLRTGKKIHGVAIRNEIKPDIMLQTSLIDMYGKCGCVDYAKRLFEQTSEKNIVIWNSMIGGYVINGKLIEAFTCFKKLQGDDHLVPDVITAVNLLPACGRIEDLPLGKSIHGFAIRKQFIPHLVLETSLIDMYGKYGELKLANSVFINMRETNLVSWNAIVTAYVHNGQYREAFVLFRNLLNEPYNPDSTSIATILPAYAEVALLRDGKQIHGYIIKLNLSSVTIISNSVVNMYAKCGDLKSARKIFDRIMFKDIVTWNTMIMGYAIHGFGSDSVKMLSQMTECGVEPNESTFASLLLSCSNSGMVNKAWEYFNAMKRNYGIVPGIEHYGCIVDIIGRSSNLELAKKFIDEMPLKPTPRIWGSLLAASRQKRNIEIAELASKHILSFEHDNTGCYVLLSNMYAEAGRWEDVERIKNLLNNQGLNRTNGYSTIENKGKIHKFVNLEKLHSMSELVVVYNVLDIVSRKTGDDMFMNSFSKFKPVELLKKKLASPECHSVRLAVCFGLISESIGKPILVRKNIRLCEACHGVVKKISEITKREIIVGDPKMYHHFRNGRCSCGEY